MSKKKKNSPHHSASTEKLLRRLISGKKRTRQTPSADLRSRQTELNKNAAPRQRIRIVQFSTWGSDYRQIDLSARLFWGMVLGVVFAFVALIVVGIGAAARFVQNYRLSSLTEKQEVLRNRLNQSQNRVNSLSLRAGGVDGDSEFALDNTKPADTNDRDVKANGLNRNTARKRGPLGLAWTNDSAERDTATEARRIGEMMSQDLADGGEENNRESSIFYGQGGGAYVDEEDNIYPTLLEKERAQSNNVPAKESQNYATAAMPGNDIISELEKQLSHTQELQKTIVEKFEVRRKQLEHIPSIKPLLSGRITDLFGKRRDPFVARSRHHQGIDIGAPRGTEVFSPANGVIEFVKTTYRLNRGYGRAVVINHGYGIKTLYGHLSKINVKVGQRIERWDLIGLVGETGRATGPHLHYEVWVDGEAQDPLRFILNN
jgi:murein DD-endopeptidase MepM/ murein hydrolase activator NlpD